MSSVNHASPIVTVDSRGRAHIGRYTDAKRLIVEQHDDGSVTLWPAAVLTEHELALERNPKLLAELRRSNPVDELRRRSG